ncbi:hypothetical protein CPB84DRAFT_1398526 [Gymnopilus junonius]|uniref:Uncharacterized protein n=1 Tax=Gymnopilus junonius TaxID=109634 RepID=A0A9P5NGX8_GYMJU|nr:hypothetical protein CPB84DRAFT_1398526 [Gymnopilus junonius]
MFPSSFVRDMGGPAHNGGGGYGGPRGSAGGGGGRFNDPSPQGPQYDPLLYSPSANMIPQRHPGHQQPFASEQPFAVLLEADRRQQQQQQQMASNGPGGLDWPNHGHEHPGIPPIASPSPRNDTISRNASGHGAAGQPITSPHDASWFEVFTNPPTNAHSAVPTVSPPGTATSATSIPPSSARSPRETHGPAGTSAGASATSWERGDGAAKGGDIGFILGAAGDSAGGLAGGAGAGGRASRAEGRISRGASEAGRGDKAGAAEDAPGGGAGAEAEVKEGGADARDNGKAKEGGTGGDA